MSDFNEYHRNGLYFAYPSNWGLEEDGMETVEGSVQLSNNDDAFWILRKYPLGTDTEAIITSVVESMQADYEDMEIERVEKTLFDTRLVGNEMNFFYLDLMNTATILCFNSKTATYAVFWQTGNQLIVQAEESVPVDKVFEAITYSLLRGK